MKYNVLKNDSPTLPRLLKGTECISLLLTQVSKDMRKPILPMFFPILGAHLSEAQFQYPDRSWKEPCGMMANLRRQRRPRRTHHLRGAERTQHLLRNATIHSRRCVPALPLKRAECNLSRRSVPALPVSHGRFFLFSHRYHRYHGYNGPTAVGNRQSQTSVRSASQSEGNSVDSGTFIRQASVSSVSSVGDYFL